MKKLAGILLGSALITGCVGHYQQPDAQAPHAVLEAIEGENQLIFSGFHGYWAYHDADCTDTEETGVLGTRKADTTERFLLKPDRRIFVSVMTSGGLRQTDGYYSVACLNVGSFIPSTGATYQVRQRVEPDTCALSIIDARTGKAPESFRREQITEGCR